MCVCVCVCACVCRLIHDKGFSDKEKAQYRHVVRANLANSMLRVLLAMTDAGQDFSDPNMAVSQLPFSPSTPHTQLTLEKTIIPSLPPGLDLATFQSRVRRSYQRAIPTLTRCPFHPRVTAVARKRPRSFCQKCRWQVTAIHAYTFDPTRSE